MMVDTRRVTTRRRPWSAGTRRLLGTLYRLLDRSPARLLLRLPLIEGPRRRVTATRVGGADAVEIFRTLTAAGLPAWLSGGWACDALLGEQTRPHADVDIVVSQPNRQSAVKILERQGFTPSASFDAELEISVVELIDRRRRLRVGLHFVDIESDGPEGWAAAVGAAARAFGLDVQELFTTGAVEGHELPCLSAPAVLALHTGYPPHDADWHDVLRLCARFALPVPPEYASAPDAA